MRKLIQLIIISTLLPYVGFAQQDYDLFMQNIVNQGELKLDVQQDTIPIEIWYDQILLKVKVNGKEGFFMWDNGFSFSAVDKSFAPELNLKEFDELKSIEAKDAINTKVKLDIKLANSIDFGKSRIANSPILISGLDAMFGTGHKLSGVLGANSIKKLNWKFNFDEKYVVVSKNPFKTKGIEIAFQIDKYNLMHTVFGVNGHLTYAEVDFGYNGDDVAISMQAYPLFAHSPKNKGIGQSTSSVSGMEKVDTSYVIKDFNYVISDTLTTVPHKFEMFLSNSERGIRIGNRFFRHYNCVVNNSTNKIILTDRKTAIKPMPKKGYGIILQKLDGQLKVTFLFHNPNTLKYPNIKLHEVITEINGKRASDFKENRELRDFQINLLTKDQKLIMTSAGGEKITLTPEYNIYE